MTGKSFTRRGFIGLTAAAGAGLGLSACTGTAGPSTSGAGSSAPGPDLKQTARLHLRGRLDHRPAEGPDQDLRRAGRNRRPPSTPCRVPVRRSIRTSCGPSCSAAAVPTSGGSGAVRSVPRSRRPSRPSISAPYYTKFGWDSKINAGRRRRDDLRRRQVAAFPFIVARHRRLVQQGHVQEGRRRRGTDQLRRAGGSQ